MKNIKKKVSALVLTTMFAVMQVSAAIDTGLGAGNGGAVINNATGGFVGVETGENSATLNFNGNSHVNWNTLNVNSNETLNFNAVNGATGVTVINTVNSGMSNIYGQINSNAGISKLIISNPNGVLFDGASFTTAGDTMITTQALNTTNLDLANPTFTNNAMGVVTIQNSDFSIGGDFNVIGNSMNVVKSAFTANNGAGNVHFVTTNGQDYIIDPSTNNPVETQAVRLEAVQVDGNVYITSDRGVVKTVGGGQFNGDLNIDSNGSVALNYVDNGKVLNVTGDVNAKANGTLMYARNTKVGGNLNMENGGGFLEVGNVQVGEDMNLKTTAESENPYGYKHFVHVIGNNTVGGDATINSENNIHIGNYNFEEKKLLDGNLEVGGTLTAHANNGHVMTTINVQADKIDYTSDKLNILTDDKAVLTANEYSFKSNGYIGGLQEYTKDGKTYTTADQVISLMENYTYIPKDIESHAYTQIAGGKITNIETPNNSQVYIASNGDVVLTGANAGDINLTAYRKRIDIQGPNVHANNINVGPETDYLKVEFEGRDFTTNYTNIRDGKVVTIKPDEKITYDMTDGQGGNNQPTLKPGEKTTYLIGPNKPDPTPEPSNPSSDDNVRVRNWVPDDPTKPMASTPVAYAADLDEEEDVPCRKNVDGSVTVVKAYPVTD